MTQIDLIKASGNPKPYYKRKGDPEGPPFLNYGNYNRITLLKHSLNNLILKNYLDNG